MCQQNNVSYVSSPLFGSLLAEASLTLLVPISSSGAQQFFPDPVEGIFALLVDGLALFLSQHRPHRIELRRRLLIIRAEAVHGTERLFFGLVSATVPCSLSEQLALKHFKLRRRRLDFRSCVLHPPELQLLLGVVNRRGQPLTRKAAASRPQQAAQDFFGGIPNLRRHVSFQNAVDMA